MFLRNVVKRFLFVLKVCIHKIIVRKCILQTFNRKSEQYSTKSTQIQNKKIETFFVLIKKPCFSATSSFKFYQAQLLCTFRYLLLCFLRRQTRLSNLMPGQRLPHYLPAVPPQKSQFATAIVPPNGKRPLS